MEYRWKFNFHDDYFVMAFDEVEEVHGDKSTLTGWLFTDVRDFRGTLGYIDDVISEKTKEDFLSGNAYNAYVKKDFTEIHFQFEDENPSIKPCTVPTKLLREIVKAWLDEYEEFYDNK